MEAQPHINERGTFTPQKPDLAILTPICWLLEALLRRAHKAYTDQVAPVAVEVEDTPLWIKKLRV